MKTSAILFISCFFIQIVQAKIHYVKEGGTGNGTSWEDASGDLNAILFAANYGDEIWVTRGTYLPTHSKNRDIFFRLNDGIKLFGGFKGTETSISERNWIENKTILSGEIGEVGAEDNSYTVIYTKNTSGETTLDGVIIEGGFANQGGSSGNLRKSGGGMYNDGGLGGFARLVIRNCVFSNNYARDGGAVYNNGADGNSSPIFVNCRFYNNRTDLDGGAVYNDGRSNGKSNPVFENCEFVENKGNYGGAIFNFGAEGFCNPTFINCYFLNNEVWLKGRNIFNVKYDGTANPKLINCKFGNAGGAKTP